MNIGIFPKVLMLLATPFVSGCVTSGSLAAYCEGTEEVADDHTAALLADGGDLSVETGALFIALRDRVCQ
jgi:hypothetical protein